MSRRTRALRRYLDDLSTGRRPGRRPVDPGDDALLRLAIALRSTGTDGDGPSEEFVSDLHNRLSARFDPAATEELGDDGRNRRRVVLGASAAAVAAAAGVGAVVDHTLLTGDGPDTSAQLTPNSGSWHPVLAAAALPEGGTYPFDLGTVTGFVHRTNGQLTAVSGICTHQGCHLWFDAAGEQLRCPCHLTSFAVTGQVLTHQLRIAPAALPQLPVRESDGRVEIFAPTEPS